MVNNRKIKISIIGAGRVGTTIACVLAKKKPPNIKISAISSRSKNSLIRAKKILDQDSVNIYFTQNNIEAASTSKCCLICTPDDVISKVCKQISESDIDLRNYIIIHFSGSKSLKILNSAKNAGALIASIHPLKSFASIEEAVKTISGAVFGVTCSDVKARRMAAHLVKALGGSIIEVEDDKKPLYHAAACVASNYLVSLINYAVTLHEKIGIKPSDSLRGLMSLVEGTVGNIKKMGTKESLTGPIARGDIGTVAEHLKNFNKYFKREDVNLYKIMGVETSKIAYQNGWIDKNKFKDLVKLLDS